MKHILIVAVLLLAPVAALAVPEVSQPPPPAGAISFAPSRLADARFTPQSLEGMQVIPDGISPPSGVRPPVTIILDTDMGGDCDDVGALYLLHGAVERGEARLLATIGCISSDAIAPALDAINTRFGRPAIAVGTLKEPGFLAGPHYTAEIARRLPHKFASGKDYPDAVALYRQVPNP